MRAFLSTYLDIALGNIGRLGRLAHEQNKERIQETTYQSTDENLAGSRVSDRSRMSRLGCSLGRLLDASDGRLLGGSATTDAATVVLAAIVDEIVKRFIQVGRHDDE